MLLRLILTLGIFYIPVNVFAQQNSPTKTEIGFGIQKEVISVDVYSKRQKITNKLFLESGANSDWYFLYGKITSDREKGGIDDLDLVGKVEMTKIGLIRGSFGIEYHIRVNNNDLLLSNNVAVNDQTRKRSLFATFNFGQGTFNKNYYRVALLVGAADFLETVELAINGQVINTYGNSVYYNIIYQDKWVMVIGPNINAGYTLWKLNFNGDMRYLTTRHNFENLIPKNNLVLEGEATYFPIRHLGLSLAGKYSDNTLGLLNGSSIAFKTKFKF